MCNGSAASLNQKQLTALTEFALPAGKVYLSPVIDCLDGIAHSWTVCTILNAHLVNNILENVLATLHPGEHPIFYTDWGYWLGWIKLVDYTRLTRSIQGKGVYQTIPLEKDLEDGKNEMFYGQLLAGVSLERLLAEYNSVRGQLHTADLE